MECVRYVGVCHGAPWEKREDAWMRGLGLGFTKPMGTGGSSVGHVSVFGLRLCGCCWWGVGRGLDQGLEGWDGVMSV